MYIDFVGFVGSYALVSILIILYTVYIEKLPGYLILRQTDRSSSGRGESFNLDRNRT